MSEANDHLNKLADLMNSQFIEEQEAAIVFSEESQLSEAERGRLMELALRQSSRNPGEGERALDDPSLLDYYATRLSNYLMAVKGWVYHNPGKQLPYQYTQMGAYLDINQSNEDK